LRKKKYLVLIRRRVWGGGEKGQVTVPTMRDDLIGDFRTLKKNHRGLVLGAHQGLPARGISQGGAKWKLVPGWGRLSIVGTIHETARTRQTLQFLESRTNRQSTEAGGGKSRSGSAAKWKTRSLIWEEYLGSFQFMPGKEFAFDAEGVEVKNSRALLPRRIQEWVHGIECSGGASDEQ